MRSVTKLGLAWAIGSMAALSPTGAGTDDPMDPAFESPVRQSRRTVAAEPAPAPDAGQRMRQQAVVPQFLKSNLATVSFSTPFAAPVGGSPRALVVADFDGDGLADVAVANKSTDDVSVLFASGPGTFLSARDFAAGDEPRSLAAGDLNGDGLDDLVVSNKASIDLSVLLADGGGGFEPAATVAISEQPGALAVADLDGDDNADLIVTFPESDRVAVLLGFGDGTFGTNTQFATGRAPVSVAVADLDGDGVRDVVTANRVSNDVSVLRGAGDGTLLQRRHFTAGVGPFHVVVVDLNDDGLLDLAVADYDGDSLAVLPGDGPATFGVRSVYPAGAGPSWVAPADFNADGRQDLAVVNFTSGNVMVFAGDGAGGLAPTAPLDAGAGPRSLASSDFDDDGRVDLVVAARDDNQVAWLLNEGPFPSVPGPPTAVAGADQTHECTSSAGATVRLDGSASTADSGEIDRYEWLLEDDTPLAEGAEVEVVLPLGSNRVVLQVTDTAGETATDTVEVVVEDTTAPQLSIEADPFVLLPADHRMVPVHVRVETSDVCGDTTVVLVSVASNQPDDAPGTADGETTNDVQGAVVGTADFDFDLRAEHDVRDEGGRNYAVVYQSRDASGNVTEETRNVVVPYDETPSDDEDDPTDEDTPDDPPDGDDDDDDDAPWDGDDDDDDDAPLDGDDDDDDDARWDGDGDDDDDDDDYL